MLNGNNIRTLVTKGDVKIKTKLLAEVTFILLFSLLNDSLWQKKYNKAKLSNFRFATK